MSERATICFRQHRCDSGVGDIWSVRLADGFLLDCGHDGFAMQRAETLATLVNKGDPSLFSAASLSSMLSGKTKWSEK